MKTGSSVRTFDVPNDDDFRSLGKFDYEGTYEKFVTMCHKRYAYDEGEGWRYRASGYNLQVLAEFGGQLAGEGAGDLEPLVVLGYDALYAKSTGIATAQSGVDVTWAHVTMEAQDETGDRSRMHTWAGWTCPGYSIEDAEKVVGNTKDSVMSRQYMFQCLKNNPDCKVCFGMKIEYDKKEGKYVYDKREDLTEYEIPCDQ